MILNPMAIPTMCIKFKLTDIQIDFLIQFHSIGISITTSITY